MRHQKKTIKLGRTAEHRKALLANQVCSLIAHERIRTTLAKAKAVRPLAEKMVTLGKKGSIHARRTAFALRSLLLCPLHEGRADVIALLVAEGSGELPVDEHGAARILAAGRFRVGRDKAVGHRLNGVRLVEREIKPGTGPRRSRRFASPPRWARR